MNSVTDQAGHRPDPCIGLSDVWSLLFFSACVQSQEKFVSKAGRGSTAAAAAAAPTSCLKAEG